MRRLRRVVVFGYAAVPFGGSPTTAAANLVGCHEDGLIRPVLTGEEGRTP